MYISINMRNMAEQFYVFVNAHKIENLNLYIIYMDSLFLINNKLYLHG